MPDVFGLTPTGFVPKSTDQVRADSETRIRNRFGQSLPLGDKTLLGQLIGIVSDAAGSVWSAGEQIFSSQDPDKAAANALDAVCKITGTFRPPALPSLVNSQIITGTAGTVVATGFEVDTASTGARFASTLDVTLASVPAWTTATPYAFGAQVTNGGNVYSCTVAGTSSGAPPGPTGTGTAIGDGSCTWAFCGAGTAAANVEMASIETGPIEAVAFDLTQIKTPIGGVDGTTNLLDAVLGFTVASDELLRVIREEELQNPGKSPVDAIRAAMLNVAGVTTATVFYNPGDTTDGNGLPPHSVLALVQGGVDQDIFNAIWANVAGGIRSDGTSVGTIVDAAGNDQTVRFQRPSLINIYIRVFVTEFANTYAGDDAVKLAIANGGNANGANFNAVPSQLAALAFAVAGVLDVTLLLYTDAIGVATAWAPTTGYVATPGARSVVTNDGGRQYICVVGGVSAGSGGPTGTGTAIVDGSVTWYFLGNTIDITPFQEAVYDTSRVTVVSTPGTP